MNPFWLTNHDRTKGMCACDFASDKNLANQQNPQKRMINNRIISTAKTVGKTNWHFVPFYYY